MGVLSAAVLIRRPKAVLLSFGVLLVVAVLVTGILRFEQDIFALLPQDDRAFQILSHVVRSSDGQERLYIVIQGRRGPTPLTEAGEDLAETLRMLRIEKGPAFSSVTSLKVSAIGTDFQELLADYFDGPERFLTERDLSALNAFLSSPETLDAELRRSLALLATPGSPELTRLVAMDPLNLRRFLVEKLQALHGDLRFSDGPFMLSPRGDVMLLVAVPAFPANDRKRAGALLQELDRLRAMHPDLRIGLTGGYALAAQEEALLRGDLLSCLVGSALGISLLFLIMYRRFLVLVFVVLPLAVGLQLALGVMALAWGEVHLLAVAFSAVVLGLGIDFAIHVYDRYAMERLEGSSPETAVERSVTRTGAAVLVGGLTTLIAFSVLTLTHSPVLRQIGWLVSLGLLFCLLTILLALPAWLIWLERHGRGRPDKALRLMGMDRLGGFVARNPLAALLIGLCLVAVSLPGLKYLAFEHDPMALQPRQIEAIEMRRELQTAFGTESEPVLVTWRTRDTAAFWETGRQVDRVLEELHEKGLVNRWASITRFVNERPSAIPDLDLDVIGGAFEKYGLRLEDFTRTHGALQALTAVGASQYTRCEDLNGLPRIYQRFFLCSGDGPEGIAWVYVSQSAGTIEAIQDRMSRLDPRILVITPQSAVGGLMDSVRSELEVTAGVAGILVLGILALFFRRLPDVVLALLPTALGLVTTAGVMGYLGIPINLMNFIVIPILIGIGLDDGVHILGRYRELGDVRLTLATTGRSILLTTLTTALGFGSLAFARYHVLASMGFLTIVGVLTCFFYSAVTLPAVLVIRDRMKQQRTRAHP
jgi:predicted RND superfamily exporter protein